MTTKKNLAPTPVFDEKDLLRCPLLPRAIKLIQLGHDGQLYNNRPYWHHPVRVCLRLRALWLLTDSPLMVYGSLFHDLAEDSMLDPADLEIFGFPPQVSCVVKHLTHDSFDKRTYMEYIQSMVDIVDPAIRRAVCFIKLADLVENIRGAQFLPITKLGRLERYGRAISILTPVLKAIDETGFTMVYSGEQDKQLLTAWIGEEPTFL